MEKNNSQIQKIAIITGGTSGLGLAMAKKFVEKEILTIVTGRDDAKLNENKGDMLHGLFYNKKGRLLINMHPF